MGEAAQSITEQSTVIRKDNATEQAIVTNAANSLRQFAPGAYGGFIGNNFGFMLPTRPDLLPRYGTLECDIALRMMHYTQHNSLVGSAVEVFAEKYLSIPYEISGGRNLTFQWQDLFAQAEFGEGYHTLMHESIVDYCTLNRGFFLELVSYGDPSTPLKEGAKILGINHLDALRIQFTGNLEWPYLYLSEWSGGLHRIHASRVIHVARQPSPDTLMYGMGKSSLYEAISVANAQVLLGRHQNELLSDLPPSGMVIFSNIKPDMVDDAMKQFEYERRRDGQTMYRAPIRIDSLNPEQPATVTFVPMATVPEGFDYEKFMSIHINMTALAFGLDPQDLWPLSGKAIGSAEQSRVLAAKTDVKGPAHLADILTPIWNFRVLPRSMQWKYKAPNAEQDKQTADIAGTWVTTLKNADFMSIAEKRGIAASQVPAFADELMDENGTVRLFEDDPKEPEQVIIATTDTELTTTPTTEPTTANGETQTPQTPPPPVAEPPAQKSIKKNIDATTDEFLQEIQAIIQDGLDRTITKAGCAARVRGAIQRYGKQAYLDGLEHGCVDPSDYDEDDARIVADLAVRDSQYVTNMVNDIYSDPPPNIDAESRAQMWMGTSDEFYYAGIESADKNGMYSFEGDDGKESCVDCQRLKGQKHRMSWWVSKELRPGIDHDNFECGGWRCQHYLERVGAC